MFVKSIERFREDRYGAPLATRSVLIWYPAQSLRVISASGVVTGQDMDLVISVMRDEAQPGFHPFASLVDMSDVKHVDASGFDRFVAFMQQNADAFARVNLRSAYVSGDGNALATAAVAGYSQVIDVRRVRVMYARELRTRDDLSIADVATKIGFASPKAFRVAFSHEMGEPPSAWRARHRK